MGFPVLTAFFVLNVHHGLGLLATIQGSSFGRIGLFSLNIHLSVALLLLGEFAEYTVEKGTLESIFMKLIRQNQVDEEDSDRRKRWCF
ncbi:hypothetical protein C8J56DRAFT_950808 [Mycena floridula]|nr:hypothetical protein C8J56DRAFT_950808 [Mycena floridula]